MALFSFLGERKTTRQMGYIFLGTVLVIIGAILISKVVRRHCKCFKLGKLKLWHLLGAIEARGGTKFVVGTFGSRG